MEANDNISIIKKASLLCGADFFGTTEIPEGQIFRIQMLDGGTGMNFEQLFVNLYAEYCEKNGYSKTELDNVAHFFFEENRLSDREKELRKYIKASEDIRTGLSDIAPGCYPPGILLAATWNPAVTLKTGSILGQEANMYGVDCLLGTPNINILRDPRNGRFFEGYSEDPYFTGVMGREIVKGVESQGIASNVKHYAANNLEYKRGSINQIISERTLRDIYLPAFKMCLQAGAATVMTSYPRINGVKCTEHKWLLRKILRQEWGYNGVNMTDWGACTGDSGEAVEAGIDLLMPGPWPSESILKALEAGRLSKEHLNEAYERVKDFAVKYHYRPKITKDEAEDILSEGDKISYEAAVQGIVMLENNGVFPLSGSEKLVLYGSEKMLTCGQGSAQVFTSRNTKLDEELAEVYYGEDEIYSSEPMSVAVVLCSVNSAEGSDRKDLKLPEETIRVLDRLLEVKRNSLLSGRICLILNTPGPVELGEYLNELDAVYCVFYPGMQGAKALSDLMYGKRNPSGKLPFSWPSKIEDMPSYLNYPEGNVSYYGEGIFVGYRGYEKRKIKPLYPFGYGLSYTTFDIDEFSVEQSNITVGEDMVVSFDIENTGEMAGAEVVQIYVGPEETSLMKPVKELRAFGKYYLQPGQKIRGELSFSSVALCSWDEELKRYAIEDGIYNIYIGNSSENAKKVLAFSLRGGDLGYKLGTDSYVIKVKEKPELYKALKDDIKSHGLDVSKLIDSERYFPYTKIKDLYPEAELFSEFVRLCDEYNM
ncbi:MAG: glycoside hydrolase family 3 C-terminal domain-containing protein [Saccharofermentans sp.]|nr:glycoside hydrolase family 3 C-terminal domain-containing protein [Saccharofermentans sp.]